MPISILSMAVAAAMVYCVVLGASPCPPVAMSPPASHAAEPPNCGGIAGAVFAEPHFVGRHPTYP